jgi:hypothetical protein
MCFRRGQLVEHRADAVEADLAGDLRRDVDPPVRDALQRLRELIVVIGVDELNVVSLAVPNSGNTVSGSMHTPATINRLPIGARRITSLMIPGTPTASKTTTGVTLSNGDPCAGSSTSWAPIVTARSRLVCEKSVATMCSTSRSRSAAMIAIPIGPHPITNAVSPDWIAALFTACRPTAIGSVRAACRGSRPSGTRSSSGADNSIRSAYPPITVLLDRMSSKP